MALQNVQLCLALWFIVATFFTSSCVGNPIRDDIDKCVKEAKTLLDIVTATLNLEGIYEGFNCSTQGMEYLTRSDTLIACEPNTENCIGCSGHRKTTFNKEACIGNITSDLLIYRAELKAYNHDDLTNTLNSIDTLIEDLSLLRMNGSPSTPTTNTDHQATLENNFSNRQRLCKVLRAFRVRSVTINRVMNYIKLGSTSHVC
ncbi:interleukin-12 subunit alpha [Amia ocellicauda]|uniref:interleukin-12 subunit alpha n=1 Tax=Amia ocellicauda TaxID=2972642 RepID=UPI00346481D0